MAERFLILGANSFYGSNFARLCAEKGEETFGLTRAQFNLNSLAAGKPPRFDLSGYDYIVNFISRSLVAESWDKPIWWYTTNTVATAALFAQLRGQKFKKFIHVSTPEVYGSINKWTTEAEGTFNPSTPYAISRAAADMAALAEHKVHGFPVVITRTANIYGPGQQPYRLIPQAFQKLSRGETFTLNGMGETTRGWIHVRDACEATYLLCKEGRVGQTYHIAPLDSWTVKEVVGFVAQTLGVQAKTEYGPERPGKDLFYHLDSQKIRKEHGWSDKIKLMDGLKGILNGSRN